MGVITDHLHAMLDRQVNDHGIVLWFDPDRTYASIIDKIKIANCRLLQYRGSFYELRSDVQQDLKKDHPPRIIVYVPLDSNRTQSALSELSTLGVEAQPGDRSVLRNTKLSVVAKKALKGKLPENRLDELEKGIESGQLNLHEAERIAEDASDLRLSPVLSVIFQADMPEDAALKFLSNTEYDRELIEKKTLHELCQFLFSIYQAPVKNQKSTDEVRNSFVRHVLIGDIVYSLGGHLPPALETIRGTIEPSALKKCWELASAWRGHRQLAESYKKVANELQKSLNLDSVELSIDVYRKVETFELIDSLLLKQISAKLSNELDEEAFSIAKQRSASFWGTHEPELNAQWATVIEATELIRISRKIQNDIPGKDASLLARSYVEHWHRIDTNHRHMEKRIANLQTLLKLPDELEKLVVVARRAHFEAINLLAEHFSKSLQKASYRIPEMYRQDEVFEIFVAPQMSTRKVAYLLVDALRYEMAAELKSLLVRDFEVELNAVVGMLPSVTEVGMAALLPRARQSMRLQSSKQGLELCMENKILRSRDQRMEYFRDNIELPIVILKLEEQKGIKKRLKEAAGNSLIVMTSQEIDSTGEKGFSFSRQMMDDVLIQICIALRALSEAGVEHVVIAADHGFLFGDEMDDSMKIEAPGGNTALLHRRVWVGQNGASSPSYFMQPLTKFGENSDLEIAIPWNLAIFRSGGSASYFHGGVSLQEIMVPVLTARPKIAYHKDAAKSISWKLTPGAAKITSRFFSVTVSGNSQLLETEWPRVKVEARYQNELCSIPVSGTYGYNQTTGDFALQESTKTPNSSEPNTITLMLSEKAPSSGTIEIALVDALTGLQLANRITAEVSLAF